MLNGRNGVLAGFVVAAICALAALVALSSDQGNAVDSATEVAGSSVTAFQKKNGDSSQDGARSNIGPEPSAFARPRQLTDVPLADVPQLAQDVRRIALASRHGVTHALYVGKDSGERTCLILQEGILGRGGGGCNPSSNPFQGSHVMWSSTHYNEDPQKLVLFGVVREGVTAVSLTLDGGSRTAVQLSQDGGFIYVVAKPVIEPSDVPKAINTFDTEGNLVEQIDLEVTFGG